jgi:hypothetical protein
VIGPGEVAITIPVNADSVYPGLRPGDAVTVLGTAGGSQADGPTLTVLERALVYDVSPNARQPRSERRPEHRGRST